MGGKEGLGGRLKLPMPIGVALWNLAPTHSIQCLRYLFAGIAAGRLRFDQQVRIGCCCCCCCFFERLKTELKLGSPNQMSPVRLGLLDRLSALDARNVTLHR